MTDSDKMNPGHSAVVVSVRPAKRTLVQVAAFHEAGHALAAMREGRPLLFVEIHPWHPGAGVTRQLVPRRRNRFNPALGRGAARAAWQDTLSRYLASIRVLLAGPLAEARAMNKPLRSLGSRQDLDECENLGRRLWHLQEFLKEHGVDTGPGVEERFNRERARVRRWVARRENWDAIRSIARLLVQRQRISAREVLQCYLSARNARQGGLPLDWDFDCWSSPVRRLTARQTA